MDNMSPHDFEYLIQKNGKMKTRQISRAIRLRENGELFRDHETGKYTSISEASDADRSDSGTDSEENTNQGQKKIYRRRRKAPRSEKSDEDV